MISFSDLKAGFDALLNLAKKAKNAELSTQILEMQSTMMDLYSDFANERDARFRAEQRIVELEAANRISKTVCIGTDSYWIRKDSGEFDGPFCTSCYDAESLLIRHNDRSKAIGIGTHMCPRCQIPLFPRPPETEQ